MNTFDFSQYGYTGTESFIKEASNIINSNKKEFDEYISKNEKLSAVKALKLYSGLGLKEAKYCFELYMDGKLPYIKEERRLKLERLAKLPLINQLILNIRKVSDDELHSVLINLTVDELLSIDENFSDVISENE